MFRAAVESPRATAIFPSQNRAAVRCAPPPGASISAWYSAAALSSSPPLSACVARRNLASEARGSAGKRPISSPYQRDAPVHSFLPSSISASTYNAPGAALSAGKSCANSASAAVAAESPMRTSTRARR